MADGILVVVSVMLLVVPAAVNGGGGIRRLLTLERAFPVQERVGLDVIKARDSTRHSKMFESYSGGIVDFPVVGTSDPYVVGFRTMVHWCYDSGQCFRTFVLLVQNLGLSQSSLKMLATWILPSLLTGFSSHSGSSNIVIKRFLALWAVFGFNCLYFTKVRLGSPPREFNVQIDTGSDILWVTCSSCNDCPQNSGLGIPLNFFDGASSSTVSSISCSDAMCASIVQTASAECSGESNQCGYMFQYGDGSGTAGFYVNDLLYFDTVLGTSLIANSSAPIVFGCSTSLFGDLTKSDRAVDGIFGFGQQGLSVISQLSSRGITPKIFSHCLNGEGSGGGILVLGEILDPRIVYTPLVPSQPHYNLYLQSIAVNGQLLPIDPSVFTTSGNQGTIVDSGTTLAYLVEAAYEPFITAVTAALSPSVTPIISKGNQCYLVSTSVVDMFPPVAFNFAGGASLVLRPVDYLVHMGFVDGASMWCIGFIKVQNQGTTILGDLVLKDKIFVYDLASQRIGWADYDCSSSVNVSITSGKDEFVNAGQLSVSSSSSSTDIVFRMMHWSIKALLLSILVSIGCLLL